MSKKIKVAGYTKKNNYTDGISYRPFSTLNKSVSNNMIFGSGNFNVTINTDNHNPKKYKTKDFSDYYTIDDIGITDIDVIRELNKRTAILNNDKTNIKNYAYFGSLKERVRVAVEQIIMNFPAGLVLNDYLIDLNGELINNGQIIYFSIDNINKKHYITINNAFLSNPYGISLNPQEEVVPSIRNFAVKFDEYVIKTEDYEFPITNIDIDVNNNTTTLHFTSTINIENHFKLLTNGKMFIVPNEYNRELFFKNLDNIQNVLLDRTTTPHYTYKLKIRVALDSGNLTDMTKQGTWITSDGYNLDFNSVSFSEYIENLITICDQYDEDFSNILIRRMVSSSLLEFDTVSSDINENVFDSSQKIKSVLAIYGRSFDNVKNYIDSLSFANNVTYDKVNNAPDEHIREIAKALGWSLFDTSVTGNWVTDNITKNSLDGMTNEEMEVELWRRLIMNSPFLFKSKGTRKAIELLNKFLGIPSALININEFVYKVKNKLDYSEVEDIVNNFETSQTISDLPIDREGYPKLKRNSEDYYFQLAGGWYSQTGGENSHIDTNEGNNPHVGDYDSGASYLKPLKNMVEGFAPYNYERKIYFEKRNNVMKPHYNGSFEGYPIGTNLTNSNKISALVQQKLPVNIELNDCGCEVTNSYKALTLLPLSNEETFDCDYDKVVMSGGEYLFYLGINRVQANEECCSAIRGKYVYNYSYRKYICTYEDVLDCARYYPTNINNGFHYFVDTATNTTVDTIDNAECCPEGSVPINDGRGRFKCRAALNVIDKCIYIDKIITTEVSKSDASIEYIDSYYTRNVKVFSTGTYVYEMGEAIYYNTDIAFKVNGYTQEITLQDFIDETGYEVNSFNGHILTITNSSSDNGLVDVTIEIHFDYIDCKVESDNELCFRIEEIFVIEGESDFDLTNFRAIYPSAVSNQIIGYDDRNENQYTYDLADGKFGLNIIRGTDVLTLHNITDGRIFEISIADFYDLNIGSPFAGLGTDGVIISSPEGDVRLKGTFVKCFDCVPYNSYRVESDTTYGQSPDLGYLVFIGENDYEYTVMGNDYCCPYNSEPFEVNGGYICTVMNDDCVKLSTVRIINLGDYFKPIRYRFNMGLKNLTTNVISNEQIVSVYGNGTTTNLDNIFGLINNNTALIIRGVISSSIGTLAAQTLTLTYSDLIGIKNSGVNPSITMRHTNPYDADGTSMITLDLEINKNMEIVPCDTSTVRIPCYVTPILNVTPMPNLGTIKIPIGVSSLNLDLDTSYKDVVYIDSTTSKLDLTPIVGNLTTNKTIFIDNVVSTNIGKIDKGTLALTNEDFFRLTTTTVTSPIRFEIGNLDRVVIDKTGVDRIAIDFERVDRIELAPCDEDGVKIIPPTQPIEVPCYTIPPAIVKNLDDVGNNKFVLNIDEYDSSDNFISSKEKTIVPSEMVELTSIFGVIGEGKILKAYPITDLSHTIGKYDEKLLAVTISNESLTPIKDVSGISFNIPNVRDNNIPDLKLEMVSPISLVPCDTEIIEPIKPCLNLTAPIAVIGGTTLSGFQLDLSVKDSGKIMKSGSIELDRINTFTTSDILNTTDLAINEELVFYPVSRVSSDLISFYDDRSSTLALSPSTITQISIGEIEVPTYKLDASAPKKLIITDLIKPC